MILKRSNGYSFTCFTQRYRCIVSRTWVNSEARQIVKVFAPRFAQWPGPRWPATGLCTVTRVRLSTWKKSALAVRQRRRTGADNELGKRFWTIPQGFFETLNVGVRFAFTVLKRRLREQPSSLWVRTLVGCASESTNVRVDSENGHFQTVARAHGTSSICTDDAIRGSVETVVARAQVVTAVFSGKVWTGGRRACVGGLGTGAITKRSAGAIKTSHEIMKNKTGSFSSCSAAAAAAAVRSHLLRIIRKLPRNQLSLPAFSRRRHDFVSGRVNI